VIATQSTALDWLVGSDEPGVVFQTKRDLLGEAEPAEAARVLEGPWVCALLAGQQKNGGLTRSSTGGARVRTRW
jgi:hypothetical protein